MNSSLESTCGDLPEDSGTIRIRNNPLHSLLKLQGDNMHQIVDLSVQRLQLLFSLVLIPLMFLGCGNSHQSDQQRAKVGGNVTYASTAVPYGEIKFIPIENINLPMYSGRIQNGIYTVNHKGGLPVGKYRVEITGWSKPNSLAEGDVAQQSTSENEQFIPSEYNSKSKLELEVESVKKLQHNFELK